MAKKTKKYDLTRSMLQERISSIAMTLQNIDSYDLSPNDLSEQLGDVVEDLERLADEAIEEAY